MSKRKEEERQRLRFIQDARSLNDLKRVLKKGSVADPYRVRADLPSNGKLLINTLKGGVTDTERIGLIFTEMLSEMVLENRRLRKRNMRYRDKIRRMLNGGREDGLEVLKLKEEVKALKLRLERLKTEIGVIVKHEEHNARSSGLSTDN